MSTLKVNNLTDLGADAVVTNGVIDSGALPAGSIIAVKHVLKTDTFSASVASGGNVAVTDLSITHEVADASNKLIISAFFGSAGNSNTFGQVGLGIYDGTNLIGAGDSAGSRPTITVGGRPDSVGATNIVSMPSATFVHTPGAGSKTYTVRAFNFSNLTQTLYINRTESDSDSSSNPRSASAIVIQEVAV